MLDAEDAELDRNGEDATLDSVRLLRPPTLLELAILSDDDGGNEGDSQSC